MAASLQLVAGATEPRGHWPVGKEAIRSIFMAFLPAPSIRYRPHTYMYYMHAHPPPHAHMHAPLRAPPQISPAEVEDLLLEANSDLAHASKVRGWVGFG